MSVEAAPSDVAPTATESSADRNSSESGQTQSSWHEDPWLGRIADWDDAEADAAIRDGIPIGLAAHLQELLSLTDEEAAQLIGRSRSTYARYRNAGRDLGMAEAERAVRLAQLIALAAETFGALDEALGWMRESNYALGGRVPFDLAETDPGARVVRDLIHGIQHGHPA
jgi:putative toxin-antitoxin system antitoxin component (TIGR02293 family)